MTRPARRRQDVPRGKLNRLLRALLALDLDHRTACRELKLCREALRRERLARWGIRPLDAEAPATPCSARALETRSFPEAGRARRGGLEGDGRRPTPREGHMSNRKTTAEEIVDILGATVDWAVRLPDGSGAAVASFPLPKNHWIYGKDASRRPPMPFRMGTADPRRQEWAEKIRAAARYAIRGATMDGADTDFDPDALVQNLIVGLLGYWTPDGLSKDDCDDPEPPPPGFPQEQHGG